MDKLNKKGVTTISCCCPKSVKDKYQELYPYTLSRFLIKCITLAVKDKKFFDKIYFNSYFIKEND